MSSGMSPPALITSIKPETSIILSNLGLYSFMIRSLGIAASAALLKLPERDNSAK